jgi:hypothetical protein
MKKFKLLITSLFLAMALLFVNISPVKVYADDIGDDPQGTSQKKAAPPQISPDALYLIMTMLRLW